MPLMGIREYGRHAGISHVGILKAIRSGRIGRTAEGLIDSDQADRDLLANTHPAGKVHRVTSRPERGLPAWDTRRVDAEANASFAKARVVREHYQALLAKVDYEERLAKLVNADEVRLAAIQVEREFKEYMLRLPERLAASVAAESDPHRVHELLAGEIRRALSEFADQVTAGPR